ncbi:DUF2795 domain-containing protein [Geobacter sp. DSM 9736]|uniref:DUF2795 domain-containing protein n=1 Tax=Geobacter sp. DSM 9736 TaxID=1277350 RepID=UPI000B4FDA83|nr:DUF2795 domain-containing protein [Geobacter sp. DSM 9736]SNB46360.1 Protein of unknown function [Geobacter sp. DSM 9736]
MATSRNVGRGGGHSPANVTKHLKGINFPANKQDLIKHAKHEGADQEVLQELQGFEDREYGNMADVMKSFGKGHTSSPRTKSTSTQSRQSKRA